MFTEREKEVLGKYLTWYMVMRSPRLEEEQEDILKIIESIKHEKLNGQISSEFKTFTYQKQIFAYHFKSVNAYKVDQLTSDVINAYNADKNNVLESLKDKYSSEEINWALKSINSVVAANA